MSDRLREHLVSDLTPVRRVGPPWRQALAWFGLASVVTAIIVALGDLPVILHKFMVVPDRWTAELGAFATATLAAVAAFQLSRPDRSPVWALLPAPALSLWVSASFVGSARLWPPPGFGHDEVMDAMLYPAWVIGFSVPMSLATFWLLRRGYTLFPKLTGAMAGLAVSSIAAAWMALVHPGEVPLFNLVVHAAAVLLVVVANRALGRLWLSRHVPPLNRSEGNLER